MKKKKVYDYIMVRMTEHEKEKIEAFAKKLEKHASTFMREVTLSHISYTINDKIDELKEKEHGGNDKLSKSDN